MAKLEKVVITKKIIRPYGGVAEPEVGMTGHIVQDNDTPKNNTCIRFLATTLGYSYDPEYDDADRKYIKVYVPNNNFEVINPKTKNTEEKSKVVPKKESMKQPDIMYTLGTDWKILPGHRCSNQGEMEKFIKEMDPTGVMMKVVDLAEIKNINEKKVTSKKVEKMKQPQIMINSGTGWEPMLGHGCYNQKEMEEYVQTLDPNGNLMKVMDLAKVTKEQLSEPNTKVSSSKMYKM